MRHIVPLLLMFAACAAPAQEMVFIAPTNHAMPLANFADGQLTGGIIKDLSAAIAHRLGRQARFVSVPSKRVGIVLSSGEADAVCYVLPDWIDGDFDWSRPLVPNGVVVVGHPDAPPVRKLADLAGRRIGTVIGYRYGPIEAAIGKQFIRDDAPSSQHSLNKLVAGRTNYAVVEQAQLAYQLRTDRALKLRTDLVVATFKAQCAFSRKSQVPFAQVERAISALVEHGEVEQILAHYR